MSTYSTNQIINPAPNMRGGDESNGLVRRMFQSAIRKWRRRKMIAMLETLDDRVLEDIGIHRGDIPRVVDAFDDRELGMTPVGPAAARVEVRNRAFWKAF